MTEDVESRVNDVKSQAEQSVKNSLINTENSVLNSIKSGLGNILTNARNSVINSVTGGLGNIYGKGMGVAGAVGAVEQELSQQIKSLQSKAIGNIHDTTTNASRSLTGAVTAPVLGSIKDAGAVANSAVDSATNMVNESKSLGNIIYNSQAGLANQIGKNRLNAKLGKL